MTSITLSEIESLDDPLYDHWLDLYQTSFPVDEQMLVSSLNKILRNKAAKCDVADHILACLDSDNHFAALAHYETLQDNQAAVLWYLAVDPERRSNGIGGTVYGMLRDQIRNGQPDARAIFLEVQDPKLAESEEDARDSDRRIAFYRRNGLQLLGGIDYTQTVGWQPSIPMLIMADALKPMSAAEVATLAGEVFGEDLKIIGVPELT